MYRNSRKSSIKPPAGLIFFKHVLGGLYREGGFIQALRTHADKRYISVIIIQFSEMHQREQGFSTTDLWFPGVILLFLTIRKW